jgi:hypothetical protein
MPASAATFCEGGREAPGVARHGLSQKEVPEAVYGRHVRYGRPVDLGYARVSIVKRRTSTARIDALTAATQPAALRLMEAPRSSQASILSGMSEKIAHSPSRSEA